jgi:hypothetical protein
LTGGSANGIKRLANRARSAKKRPAGFPAGTFPL